MIYEITSKSHSWAGETIGIIVLDCDYPYIPGNVANATTYNFPVRYAAVSGATSDRLIYERDEALLAPFIEAAQKLEAEGVKAITSGCGFMALFQKEIAAAVNIPVFLSSLLQVPFIHQITNKRVGIITANSANLGSVHLANTGIGNGIPLAVAGMEHNKAFFATIFEGSGTLDDDAIREGVVDVALGLQKAHPDLGSILLECSDLPPYAHAIQAATGLPVFDFISMIKYVHTSLACAPYSGRM